MNVDPNFLGSGVITRTISELVAQKQLEQQALLMDDSQANPDVTPESASEPETGGPSPGPIEGEVDDSADRKASLQQEEASAKRPKLTAVPKKGNSVSISGRSWVPSNPCNAYTESGGSRSGASPGAICSRRTRCSKVIWRPTTVMDKSNYRGDNSWATHRGALQAQRQGSVAIGASLERADTS